MRASRTIVIAAAVSFAIAAPLGASAAATSSGVQPTTGTIEGTIGDPDGVPMSDVCAEAYDAGGHPVTTALSDSTGRYEFQIAPGTYTIEYSGCLGADVQPQFYDNVQDVNAQTSVTVAAGDSKTLDPQKMQPGGDVSLTITNSQGLPVSGLHVFAQMYDSEPALAGLPVASNAFLTTDTHGYVHFSGMFAARYSLTYEVCPTIYCALVGSYADHGWNDFVTPVSVGYDVINDLTDRFDVPAVTVSTTRATASLTSTTVGEPVTVTATVTRSDRSVPSGSVWFYTDANDYGWVPLDGNGIARLTLTDLPVGTTTVNVYYYPPGLVTASSAAVVLTVGAASSGGGSGSAGGSGGGGGGGAVGSTVTGTVGADGSLSSDPAGTKPDVSNPLVVGVTSPSGGNVAIDKTPPDTAIANYRVLNVGATITAPLASAADPLKLSFQIFDGDLPDGSYASDITVFRDGTAVSPCSKAGVASPDPCVTSESTSSGVTTIDILSSHASTWDVEAADVGRIAGSDRIATAVAISHDSFPNGNAGAVVLARGDDYPDALVGAPLAAAKNAPLLLTLGATLSPATFAEISRVLPAGGTVYVLGSDAAVPAAVQTQLSNAGFQAVRYGGADRFATAVAVADALGDPSNVLLATGTNFPDALAAGPAAAHIHGVVLLTNGSTVPPTTATYLSTHATTVYAVGGPAAAADSNATALVGGDRFATAVAVATKFFTGPTSVGVATGASFPDALSGGAQLALTGSPLLLAAQDGVPKSTADYLSTVNSSVAGVHVFGGTPTLSDSVVTELRGLSAAG